ncbi:methyltransferase [Christensenellaceae bacterium]|nr:methyltransferase [Christensenellaceae bacterium]BDF60901.1 methyltransferase [Christensenellaceae bacterium]
MSKQYEALAGVYDALMYDAGYDEWAEYIADLLCRAGVGPGERVLEYACGTGNITLRLARAGYRMTATDISEEMLFLAQEKTRRSAARVEYACADMCEFALNKPVKAAIAACDGVNYILEQERLEAFFAQVYHNIQPDGVFLFDISSAHKLKHVLGNEFYFDDGDEETYFWQNTYDDQTGLLKMDITLFVAEEGTYRRFDERHMQRAWKNREITDMLESAGFGEVRSYAFLSTEQANERCDRIQFAATRRQ